MADRHDNAGAAASWKPGGLLVFLLVWTSLTTIVFWLPLVRGLFDGPSYEWALGGLRGAGTSGDYWFPVLGAAGTLVTLVLGWRGARQPFHWLLLAWHGFLTAVSTWLAITRPDEFVFRGDSLGVTVPLAWVASILFGMPLLAAVYWVQGDLRSQRRRGWPRWKRTNTAFLAALLALLPIQLVLLRAGPPHGTTDQIGVLLTIAQWLCTGLALRPCVVPR